MCAAAAVSFIAVYRIGPPTNERSVDIVRWSLQLAAAAAIWASSEWSEATVAVLIALTVWYYVPWRWLGCADGGALRRWWQRRFPPARRLLTLDEYEEQTRETTRRELERMMEYAGSPAAKPWQTVARLKDPKRFAEFVERGVHVTEEEQFDHTQSLMEQSDDDGDESGSGSGSGAEMTDEAQEQRPVSRDVVDSRSAAERRRREQQRQQKRKRINGSVVMRTSTADDISDDDDDDNVNDNGGATSRGASGSGAPRREDIAQLVDISDDED